MVTRLMFSNSSDEHSKSFEKVAEGLGYTVLQAFSDPVAVVYDVHKAPTFVIVAGYSEIARLETPETQDQLREFTNRNIQ